MKDSLVIGRVKGIQIEVHLSWFIIFALVTFSLATGYIPNNYPGLDQMTRWIIGGIVALMFFLSVLLHELSHSLLSISAGIPVKKITLFIFGGVSQLDKEPDEPLKELKIAIAGPAMSLFLSVLFFLLATLSRNIGAHEVFYVLFAYLSSANMVLAIFNLVPAFPLDGGRVVQALIWYFSGNLQKARKFSSAMGRVIGYVFIYFGIFMVLNGNILNGVWFAFIGWFINQMSQSSYQSMVMSDIFDKIFVSDFMTDKLEIVDDNLSVQALLEGYFYKYKYAVFPVRSNERITGIVSVESIKKTPRELRTQTTVRSITTPLTDNLIVRPGDTVSAAITKLFGNSVGRVLVMDQENLMGIVSKTDILNYLRIYSQLNK